MPAEFPESDRVPDSGALPESALTQLSDTPLSLYLHIPFCRVRCGYCDFNTYIASEVPGVRIADYVDAALQEIDLARRNLPDAPKISTVFFGGGTPTMLSPEELGRLLTALRDSFGMASDAEITSEANPETLDQDVLERLLEAGINRISLGMQSAVPHVLAALDRTHTPGQAIAMATAARRAGFERVSLDLIYGTPGESSADWQCSLDTAIASGADHISAYSLTVEPGTRLATRVRRGELPDIAEDEQADKYLQAENTLAAAGFTNYEISNWARSQASRSRHNLAYWLGHNWWGIGPGAHSHVGGVRWWNRKHPRAYVAALAAGQTPAQAREVLDAEQRRIERVLLELRLADGLPLDVLHPSELIRAHQAVADGLALIREDYLVLTLTGRLLADGVVRDLLD